jgi:hypothetical protein
MKTHTVKKYRPAELRRAGFDALVKELGVTGAVRFLWQYDTGIGDYVKERRRMLPKGSVREIARKIKEKRRAK